MNSIRRKRLIWVMVALLGTGIAVGLVLYALRQNISLFYTPSQVVNHEVPAGRLFRLGGMVQKGSVHHAKQGLLVSFVLTDFKKAITVQYNGILPALFREGQGIVTEGRLTKNGDFVATEVLAKHDANYMPPNLRDALKKQQQAKF